MIKNPKFMFCGDIGSPLLGIIMDDKWIQDCAEEVSDWIAEQGGINLSGKQIRSGSIFLLPSEESQVMFILRWL